MKSHRQTLQEAFDRGSAYDYRPSRYPCFNRWYNETYVDKKKCDNCEFSSNTKLVNRQTCDKCIDCKSFQERIV